VDGNHCKKLWEEIKKMKIKDFIGNATTIEEIIAKFGDNDIVLNGIPKEKFNSLNTELKELKAKSTDIEALNTELETLKKPLIVGLTISADRLIQIRKSRLQSLMQEEETNYIEVEKVEAEIIECKKLFQRNKWPVIDVTRRSVEETAANIIQYFHERMEKQLGER
jgi:hypothetical protein